MPLCAALSLDNAVELASELRVALRRGEAVSVEEPLPERVPPTPPEGVSNALSDADGVSEAEGRGEPLALLLAPVPEDDAGALRVGLGGGVGDAVPPPARNDAVPLTLPVPAPAVTEGLPVSVAPPLPVRVPPTVE